MFTPTLPTVKKNAIQGLSIGIVDKIFIEFKIPFWEKDWQGFSLLWQEHDLKEIRKRKDNWLEDVFGFYVVDYQPNILCGWISGNMARRMEIASNEEVKDGIHYLLKKFLKGQDIPDPVRIQR